jgi:predicted O-methyltransferase YrrM
MIAQALHSGVDWLEGAWLFMAKLWHARRIAGTTGLAFTEDYATPHAELWLEYLSPLRDKPDVRLLEVGSFEGGSAIWFLTKILTHPTATITCIDPFLRSGSEARFDHNVRVAGCDSKVVKIKGRSESVLPALEQASYEAIYIDGSHKAMNVLMDGVAGWRLLKPGGVMIFDDYCWQRELPPARRPQMAIDLFLEVLSTSLTVLHKDAQVIVRKT